MDRELYSDKAKTVLVNPITASSTSLIVADASRFPNPTSGQFFKITIDDGSTFEVIKVYDVSGNTFSSLIRGVDGTITQSFASGTKVENRLTAGSITEFARKQDRVGELTSVDLLDPSNSSDGNSYLCHSNDDSGSPVLALSTGSGLWRFSGYPGVATSGSVTSATTSTLTIANASTLLGSNRSGSYIVQFTTGQCAGYCRMVTAINAGSIGWSTALPYTPSAGDAYEVYSSTVTFVQSTLGGVVTKSVAGASNVTLSNVEAANGVLIFTGALLANISVYLPQGVSRTWVVVNNTTGAYTLSVGTTIGTGVTIPQGRSNTVYSDTINIKLAETALVGGVVDNTTIGSTTPSTAAFTTVTASGKVGIGTITNPTVSVGIGATDAIKIPQGTSAQRPSNESALLRYNTDSNRFEGNNGTAWGSLGGATGGGNDAVFYLNSQVVTTNYSIPSGQNAMTAGPVTIADGVTVTIPDGSTWTIV